MHIDKPIVRIMEMDKMGQSKIGATLGITGGAIVSLLLTGCSGLQMQESGVGGGTPLQVSTIQGKVHGGQQPVIGAVIQLYSAGTTGYGSAATPLLATTGAGVVTTDANGAFTLPAYVCPSNSEVYITATGGNPQVSGSANAEIAMMAALGSCATLQANASTTFIFIDEVTTVAGVWALQQFAAITPGTTLLSGPGGGGTTPAFTIGTSATNMQGLINAFGIANVLANTTTGTSPGSNASNTQTNVEYWQVNTLANILASCVNSDPVGGSANCGTLFTDATPNGGTVPADTLQAAWTIAQNPGHNVQALFGLATASAPFQSADSLVNDWTIGFGVTPNATYGTDLASPYWIAFDSYGNSWVTSPGSSSVAGSVMELDPQGNAIGGKITSYNLGSSTSQSLVTIGTEGTPFELAIDPSNAVWVSDHSGGAIFRIAGSGSAGGANGGGGAAAFGISTGTASLPTGIAVDGNGTVWAGLDGSTYSPTFGTASSQGIVGIVPSIPSSGGTMGPLSGGLVGGNPDGTASSYSTKAYSLIVDATPTATYAAAPFVFAVNNGVSCSGAAYGSISSFFAGTGTVTGSSSSTTAAQGGTTPANVIADSGEACVNAATTLSPVSLTYSGTTYNNAPALYTPLGAAVDGFSDIWVLNTAAPASISGYPAVTLAKLTPSYGTNPATGALVASYTPTVFTGGGLPTFATPQFIAIDGGNNVWITTQSISSPNPLSSFAEFNVSGTPLSPTATTTITSGSSVRVSSGWWGGTTGSSTGRTSQSRKGLAIDLSGNVWDVNSASAGTQLFVLVGAGVPTVTPISLALHEGKVGMRP